MGHAPEIRYLTTLKCKFPWTEIARAQGGNMHQVKSSHSLKEPIPKVVQEFARDKFSDGVWSQGRIAGM